MSSNALALGSQQTNNGRIVAVYSTNGQYGAETHINPSITIYKNPTSARTFVIENESEGGLGFRDKIALNSQNLIIAGGKATRFAGQIEGGSLSSLGNGITVQSGFSYGPTHLVLAGNYSQNSWYGPLTVQSQAMVILKSQQYALGKGENTVQTGGTMAWRSHIGNSVNHQYNAIKPIEVLGQGVIRQTGRAPVGAIYSDGGRNRYGSKITFTGNTWVGARGDIGGYLQITEPITGGSYTFTKVGPGLIILSRSSGGIANAWGRTELNGGVLRINTANALTAANISFNGGILEYGGDLIARTLGTGTNQIQWTSDGGFSAAGPANRTVTIGTASTQLTWGQQYFVGSGRALLLGSRYSDSTITFANALDFAGGIREVRVARGVLPSGINATGGGIDAILSGKLTNGGLRKTGDGLLQLTNSNNSYSGDTVIADGGLLSKNIPFASNIVFDGGSSGTGGVLLLQDDFTRTLGNTSGAGQIAWAGSGGFAAYGGDRTVSINTGGNWLWTNVDWGSPNFVPDGSELRFGHYFGNGTLIWEKPINFNSTPSTPRTIRVERSEANKAADVADVVFSTNINNYYSSGHLYVVGDGRFDINVEQDTLGLHTLHIYGAELRLNEDGIFYDVKNINLRYGGTLTLDNVGTYNSDSGGWMNANRLNDEVTIQMRGGTLKPISVFQGGVPDVEKVNRIEFLLGANVLSSASRDLSLFIGANTLVRTVASRATLHIPTHPDSSGSPYYLLTNALPQAGAIHGIAPWATISDRWGQFISGGSGLQYNYILSKTSNGGWEYNTANNQNSWATSLTTFNSGGGDNYNILLSANQTLNVNRYINSLILSGQTTLNLPAANRQITLHSGGLMTTGEGTSTITGSLTSKITTSDGTPLYLHINSNRLSIIDSSIDLSYYVPNSSIPRFSDLIKTGPGELSLGVGWNHKVGSLYIHQGLVNLQSGRLSINNRVYIGDGAGTDILQLAPNTRDQIKRPVIGGLPSITLHGTPYAQRGPEYGGDQAILRMGGNTKLHLENLHIQERGTIDWVGGEVSQANILWVNSLTFSRPDAILFMRNWYEYEDYLLVRRTWFDSRTAAQKALLLSQVWFEGYENFPVIHKNFDWQYYQITPFGAPEPATYGAILGTIGLGLVLWRKRRKAQRQRRCASRENQLARDSG